MQIFFLFPYYFTTGYPNITKIHSQLSTLILCFSLNNFAFSYFELKGTQHQTLMFQDLTIRLQTLLYAATTIRLAESE